MLAPKSMYAMFDKHVGMRRSWSLLSVAWVDMDDCRSAFDISRACTLRASNESRYGSVDVLRLGLIRDPLCVGLRVLRAGNVSGALEGGGA